MYLTDTFKFGLHNSNGNIIFWVGRKSLFTSIGGSCKSWKFKQKPSATICVQLSTVAVAAAVDVGSGSGSVVCYVIATTKSRHRELRFPSSETVQQLFWNCFFFFFIFLESRKTRRFMKLPLLLPPQSVGLNSNNTNNKSNNNSNNNNNETKSKVCASAIKKLTAA